MSRLEHSSSLLKKKPKLEGWLCKRDVWRHYAKSRLPGRARDSVGRRWVAPPLLITTPLHHLRSERQKFIFNQVQVQASLAPSFAPLHKNASAKLAISQAIPGSASQSWPLTLSLLLVLFLQLLDRKTQSQASSRSTRTSSLVSMASLVASIEPDL